MKRRLSFATTMGLLLAAPIAFAADGVLEINQSCIAVGCFPGDTPGFPVQTATGQSYRLTSKITLPTNTMAVDVADAATLDLAGFAIEGPITCTGSPASCTGTSASTAIDLGRGATLRNGAVRKTSGYGVVLDKGALVENVFVEQNGQYGIGGSGDGAIIRGCRVTANGADGINLSVGAGSPGALVVNSTIQSNGGNGIRGAEINVLGNTVTDNKNFGLALNLVTQDGGFAQNVIRSNNGSNANPQTAGGIQIGPNVCGNDANCP